MRRITGSSLLVEEAGDGGGCRWEVLGCDVAECRGGGGLVECLRGCRIVSLVACPLEWEKVGQWALARSSLRRVENLECWVFKAAITLHKPKTAYTLGTVHRASLQYRQQ